MRFRSGYHPIFAAALAASMCALILPTIVAASPTFQYIRSYGFGNGMQSGAGQLSTPQEVVVIPSSGDVLVVDSMNDRLQEFAPGGKFIKAFGSPGSKPGQFASPTGIGINHSGDIYVGDTFNNRVQEFSPTFKFIRQFGTFASGAGDLAVASSGDVYVADGAFIRHYTGKGAYVGSFGGTGSGPGKFHSLIDGLAVGPLKGQVWAGDYSGGRVESFTASGVYLRSVANKGATAVVGPLGVGISRTGMIYVSDNGNERVLQLNPNGSLVRVFGNSGKGALDNTASLALDCKGNVFVTDLDVGRVREYGNPATPTGKCAS